MRLINKYLYNIYIAISISIILRLWLLNTYGDTTFENEWGTLFKNLKNSGVLSYRSFEGQLIPSVYMPPLYVYFIFLIDIIIPSPIDLVKSILIFQILISGFTVYFFYKINLIFFTKKFSFISTLIFIFFPIHVYSCLQISSISIQILLNILFLYLTLNIINNKPDFRLCILLGFISALTILLRGEFILIFCLSLFFLIFYKKINLKQIIVIILFTIITVSPYLTRNYLTFNKVTITKSLGYNLWKGNNIDSGVEGSESFLAFKNDNVDKKIINLQKDYLYDFNYDDIFLKTSIKFIKENPILFFERYTKKFLSFTLLNLESSYPNYNHFSHIITMFLLSLFFLLSIIFNYQKKSLSYQYLIFNMFITISIFSIFFILPRYKLIILPAQLLIANFLFF